MVMARGLVIGSYCNDVLFKDGEVMSETLGGAASFISNVLDGLTITCSYISKVGPDFSHPVSHPPILSPHPSKTTLFHAFFSSHPNPSNPRSDRLLRRIHACSPISPSDLPIEKSQFDFGLAVGVAGEIGPETLERMLDICHHVFVDVQALIRTFDPVDGTVGLIRLKESGFYRFLPRIAFLKASAEEAVFVDVEDVRRWCCVIVTDGKDGCRIYWKDGELQITSFEAVQIDSTGAGDSFLGGFVAGLGWGLTVPDAALLGNFFGSLTVSQIGVPKFSTKMIKKVKDELERTMLCICCHESREVPSDFRKSVEHEELRAFLVEAAKLQATDVNLDEQQESPNDPGMELTGLKDNKVQQKL